MHPRPSSRFVNLRTGDRDIDRAFRIAIGDLVGNIVPYKSGLLDRPRAVFVAGLDYDRPWTRDAAINTWNGAGMLLSGVTHNTLLSTLERTEDTTRIAGQYWDAIIWTIGAWWQYLYTGDKEFLALALEATRNSLALLESTEFDASINLFRGPAVYGDGIAAYPDVYVTGRSSSILDWPQFNPQDTSKPGYGIPMHALSTNCVYYYAYVLAERMASELGVPPDPTWSAKAEALKEAINRHFWQPHKGCYRYLVDPFGGCDHQEGLGHCFVLLFGIADAEQAEAIFRNQHVTPSGIPCVWPTFARYESADGMSFGRHSGTVWPHIQGFWAHAAASYGKADLFEHELKKLARHACRDSQFAEIYHPISGEIYGGMQESDQGIREWKSCSRQTWSATGFVRMIFMGLVGMTFEPDSIYFKPLLTERFKHVRLSHLPYRGMFLDIQIEGPGTQIAEFRINEQPVHPPILPATGAGEQRITIRMMPSR